MEPVRRYISPEQCIRIRLGERSAPDWRAALVVFRDYASSKPVLDVFAPVTPVRHRLVYNMTSPDFEPWVFAAEVLGMPIALVTRCVWGGPQTAILVEELAALGVRTIIGYGVAGSLDPAIQQGAFVVAESALPTDGTTKAYEAESVQIGDPDLLRAVTVAGEALGVPVQPVTAVTVDALYRETINVVDALRQQGGQIIQMECSPFYAVSAACGVRSIWLGYVTDCLFDGHWQDWAPVIPNANENAIKICHRVLESLSTVDQAQEG